MSKSPEKRKVQAIGYGMIALILVATGYFSDRILLAVGTKNKESIKNKHPLYKAIYRRSSNKPKTLDLTKDNYGSYLEEGSFVNEAILNLSHHDDYDDFKKRIRASGHIL